MSWTVADLAALVIERAGGKVVVTQEDLYRAGSSGMGYSLYQEWDPLLCEYTFSVRDGSDVVDGEVVAARELPAPAKALTS